MKVAPVKGDGRLQEILNTVFDCEMIQTGLLGSELVIKGERNRQ